MPQPNLGPVSPHRSEGRARSGLVEVVAVWTLFGLVATEIFVTYARLPLAELYHVSRTGLAGGASRALVFLGFPTSLAAIPILAIAIDGLLAAPALSRARRRAVVAAAVLAALLCLTVVWPGVVDQADLDAKPVNAAAAAGVLIALVLTALALQTGRVGTLGLGGRGDLARLTAAAALLVVALPWLFAELGFFISHVPPLGSLFLSDELRPAAGGETLQAVHLGHHHGMDGVLLALAALALSRVLTRMHLPRLRAAVSAYLALMLVYGLANATQDAWLEQVVKRGWTSAAIPSLLRPGVTPAWGAILLAAAVAYAVLFRRLPGRSRLR